MYDKLNLFVQRTSDTPDISCYLNNAKEQTDLDTGEVCTFGNIEGLKVGLFYGGYSIIGSLAKYLYPNNIYPLDRHTTAQAIEKLSDTIHLDIAEASVTGLEFGTQFVMKKPPEEYLRKLGDAPRLQRCHFDVGTLYYKSKGKQQPKTLCFYDKRADAKAKNMLLPAGLENANLLKYEIRLKNRLPFQIGVPEVKASTLSERNFYRILMQMYQYNYFSISKSKQLKTEVMGEIRSVSDAVNVLFARLINQSDNDQISEYLDELKQERVFKDTKYYTRLKNKLQDIATKANITISDEDMRELDDAIRNCGAYI